MKPYLDFSDLCVAVWLGAALGLLAYLEGKAQGRTRIIDDRAKIVSLADYRP